MALEFKKKEELYTYIEGLESKIASLEERMTTTTNNEDDKDKKDEKDEKDKQEDLTEDELDELDKFLNE